MPIDSLGWLVRTGLVFVLVLSFLFALHRLRKGRAGWRSLWVELEASRGRSIVRLSAAALICLSVSILMPFARLETQYASLAASLLGVAWVAVAAWALTVGVSVTVFVLLRKYDLESPDNLQARRMHTRIKVLQRILVVIIWIAAIAGMLMQFERFRALGTTLLASAGVLSIVLGLSAQKTFGAVIAGVQIALSQPINLDDVVIVEGEWGRIEEITFTYVVVKIWDQRRLVLPVSYFLEKPFQNWTRKTAAITGTVFLHVDYTTPLAPLREELTRLCEAAGPLWDGKTCVLQVTEAGPETITLRALAGAPDASSAWDLRCMIREGLIDFLKANHPECLPRRRLVMEGGGLRDDS
ncbi:mechanosensitive ion channel [Pseudodesulfovibrio cashew]|uniref:Mechanosensitive ion channel n=1 Tax=Pseudodesulfovibrio cashew TaxID=2678688 RepID=A0A6I6JH24_9BACT|nr:mechanosensitive ion channel domain-containing protein [Pseudodesulfovibrio cashew]QGY40320.1 mechanosensitive ion channel [Pseudodesulfovibrio cashew]